MYIVALAVIGAIAVTVFIIDSLWSLLELVTSYLMPYFIPAEVLPLSKRFGPWAVVTGSTDGIGKQYTIELARKGINVVLISRNVDKLKNVAEEIEKQHHVKTKIITADFSKGVEVYQHIEEQLKDIPIGILVNNVGVQYEYPMPVCEVPTTKVWELVNVNVGAVTSMTRMVLPSMVARGKGAIVNVSSGSELQPLPLMAIYAATKVYIRSFTLATREEYASKGIYIQHLSPLFIITKMNAFSKKIMEGSLMVPDAASFARSAVSTLGRVQNTTGYWSHGLQYTFMKLGPEWMRVKIGALLNRALLKEHMETVKAQ